MQNNRKIPNTDKEVYAMAWMIGYIGRAPDEMRAIFPEETFEACPSFIGNGRQQREWKSGYDSGTSFYSAHALDENHDRLIHCRVEMQWEDCERGHAECYLAVCQGCGLRDYDCDEPVNEKVTTGDRMAH